MMVDRNTMYDGMIAQILGEVAEEHSLTVTALRSRRRSHSIQKARREAVVMLRDSKLSWKQIARALKRSHPTIINIYRLAKR